MNPIIFSPIQFKEHGGTFYNGKDFDVRCQVSKKLFFQRNYIPFGPNCYSQDGFENFLKFVLSKKLTKIIIDLPYIFDETMKEYIRDSFLKNGFKKRAYIQDKETILIHPNDFKLDKKDRYYVRYGTRSCEFTVKKAFEDREIQKIYDVYKESAIRINYKPRSISVFDRLSKQMLCSIAYNKVSKKIEGFVLGYLETIYPKQKVLYIVFAGTTKFGREAKVGYSLYFELLTKAFEENHVDVVEMLGASRTQNRAYTVFKDKFGGQFVQYPGSFEKLILF